jgi:hypothetical protein
MGSQISVACEKNMKQHRLGLRNNPTITAVWMMSPEFRHSSFELLFGHLRRHVLKKS